MKPRPEIKLILWDLGNVFIDPVHGHLADEIFNCNNVDISRINFDKALRIIVDKSFYGRSTLEETWKEIADAFNIEKENLLRIRDNTLLNDFNEELLSFAVELKHKYKISMGIFSDLSQIGYEVVNCNLLQLLNACEPEFIFISFNHSLTKLADTQPFFDHVIQKSKIPVGNILFIDDSATLISAASRVGMSAIHFTRRKGEKWQKANKLLFAEIKEMVD